MSSDCEALREATQGCRLVLLAATELEARPVLDAFGATEQLEVASKKVYVGAIPLDHGRDVKATLGISGCDKVNAAALLTALLQAMAPAPSLVLQFGIAGALPAAVGGAAGGSVADGVVARVGDVVVATQEAYSDAGSSSPQGWLSAKELGLPIAKIDGVESGGVFPLDAGFVAWALRTLSEAWSSDASNGGLSRGGPSRGTRAEVPALLAGPCVTSSTVTGTDEEARLIAERWGALAESMEGAAAAHVCALYDVPFLEVRSISNLVGDRNRETWQVDSAVAAASQAIASLIYEFGRLGNE